MSTAQLTKLVSLLRERQGDRPSQMRAGPMRQMMETLGTRFAPPDDAIAERIFVNGLPAEWVATPDADPSRAVLYLHGGGYVQGSPNTHRNLAHGLSRAANARVLVLDYRLAPEHPFPAALEDAVSAWRWLLSEGYAPATMAIAGDSAGGGLAVACQVQLRAYGLPLPACSVCISPWVDLEGVGQSMTSKADVDAMVGKELLDWFADTYLQGAAARAPLASPIYADLQGLPNMLIQVGTAETLLDDAHRLEQIARQAGVGVELRIWDDMVHVWHLFAPILDEGAEAIAQAGTFIKSYVHG